SEVINDIHLVDLSVSYAISRRFTASLSLPIQFATRSQVVRSNDVARTILDRFETTANGIGDMKMLGTAWLLDPVHNTRQNVSLGLGVLFPTGQDDVRDTFEVYNAKSKQIIGVQQTVDQSIQPGSGGWGIIFDLYAFHEVVPDFNLFLAGTYIAT